MSDQLPAARAINQLEQRAERAEEDAMAHAKLHAEADERAERAEAEAEEWMALANRREAALREIADYEGEDPELAAIQIAQIARAALDREGE